MPLSGTVTGRRANVWITTHAGGSAPSFTYYHSHYGIGDFSMTLDRGQIEQDLIGQVGNYFDQGALSVDGSLTAARFATSGIADFLDNLVDAGAIDTTTEYLAISGCVSDSADATYISWYLTSCQCTGYDVSIGDADTITEASMDYVHMLPQNIRYDGGCIRDD